jgi:hypothetical protein
VLNEFQSGKNANALLNSFWDRQGYQRAKTDNTLDLQKADVNATFIILSTQSLTGHEAEAAISRVVTVNLDGAKRDVEMLLKLQGLEAQMSYFVIHCMQKINPERLLQQIKETIALDRKHITGVSERILKNHSILQACANVFYFSLSIPGTVDYLERYGVNAEHIREDVMEQQKETTSANVAKTFIQTTIALVRKEEVPAEAARIDKEATPETICLPPTQREYKETLIFHLPTLLPLVRRFARQADIAIVDEKTLTKNLRNIGAIYKGERYEGKVRWIWFVEIEENQA